MKQNRFLGGNSELNPKSNVKMLVEQNPSLKKTELMSVKGTDVKLL